MNSRKTLFKGCSELSRPVQVQSSSNNIEVCQGILNIIKNFLHFVLSSFSPFFLKILLKTKSRSIYPKRGFLIHYKGMTFQKFLIRIYNLFLCVSSDKFSWGLPAKKKNSREHIAADCRENDVFCVGKALIKNKIYEANFSRSSELICDYLAMPLDSISIFFRDF